MKELEFVVKLHSFSGKIDYSLNNLSKQTKTMETGIFSRFSSFIQLWLRKSSLSMVFVVKDYLSCNQFWLKKSAIWQPIPVPWCGDLYRFWRNFKQKSRCELGANHLFLNDGCSSFFNKCCRFSRFIQLWLKKSPTSEQIWVPGSLLLLLPSKKYSQVWICREDMMDFTFLLGIF